MTRKTKFIAAICLAAQSFTSLIIAFVYLGRKKELSKTFLGLGLLGGIGSAYLFYNEYLEKKSERLCYDGDEWCDDDCDCCNDDLFGEDNSDDINFTIAEDEEDESDYHHNEGKTQED